MTDLMLNVAIISRGAKTIAPNPFYGHDATPLVSQLDPAHPEFSPAPVPKPKFLLDDFMRQAQDSQTLKGKGRMTESDSASDDGDEASAPSGSGSIATKRDSQSVLGKRRRETTEPDSPPQSVHQSRPRVFAARPRRSVSEQSSAPSPPPFAFGGTTATTLTDDNVPLRKRVRSTGSHELAPTPRTNRKVGLHRL